MAKFSWPVGDHITGLHFIKSRIINTTTIMIRGMHVLQTEEIMTYKLSSIYTMYIRKVWES